ncbi:MAG: phosphatidylserine/phosphatidylglycerophosphate/cardiolipin synthase family protein [Patescibacteria group bacterium]|jgi:cardiolipin synthase
MKYKLYTTSQKAWDGMLKAIRLAKHSIYLEMYIFLDDIRETHDFLGLLKAKARAGIEVVIIADAFGSASLKGLAVKELKSAGIEFIYFSHWFRRLHRKILIIDNRIAFLGGVNIEEKIRHWRDLQIGVSGRIVKPLLKSFALIYKKVGGRKENILKYSRLPLVQKLKSWITDNFSAASKLYYLNEYYRTRIAAAKKSIKIVTPYLLPPRWLLARLDEACRRNVQVDIIIPEDTDVKPLNKINYLNACRMSAFGINFFRLPFMNHAKLMLIDDEEGVIGSQNMDILSFNLNMEAGVFFRQKGLVDDLRRIVEHWKNEAVFFKVPFRSIKLSDRIFIGIFKIFYPIF